MYDVVMVAFFVSGGLSINANPLVDLTLTNDHLSLFILKMVGGNEMKKLLLAGVAVSGLAFAIPAAHADIDLDVGGYFKGYGVFVNQDENTGEDVATFDIIRDTEIHLGGETTLDNGLTVGAHFELTADGGDDSATNESYVYFSGDWGRVNFGVENGVGYLLQVAAPSADDNVDGIAPYVSPFTDQTSTINFEAPTPGYAMAASGKYDKLTYLSPVMSGFQAGFSFTPDTSGYAASAGIDTDTNVAGTIGETYEFAVRYEGDFENVGVIAGAGYSLGKEEGSSTTTDDRKQWNVGLDLDIAAFGIGGSYLRDNNAEKGSGADSGDTDTYIIGADYTTGPFKLGVSYWNQEDKATNGIEYDRYTAGVVYEYGPGMSFRGSVQFLEQDNVAGTADTDGTAVLLGTDITF